MCPKTWGSALILAVLLSLAAPVHAAAPTISSLSPTSGPVGQSVTINGSNFGSSQGSSTVKFNGTTATPTSWSSTKIVAPVPSGATTGNVVVTVSGAASNGKSFTVTPYILSLSPTSGIVGTSVTITGTTFGSTQGSSTVKFNGKTATPTSWNSTTIVAPVPSGATTGNVVVTVSSHASNGVSFTVYVTPSISSLSPTSGAVGTSVTVNGSNFQATQGSSTVTFNNVGATPTSWTNTQIQTSVPSGATTGNVVVTVAGLASGGKSFTVLPTPTISSFSPTSAAVGISVTISGTNFGSSQGSSTVKFNGTTATPTSWGAGQIVVPVPSGATTGNLVVHTSGVDVNAGTFTVETISSISVTPTNPSVPINSVEQYTATAIYGDSSKQVLGNGVTWTSSNTSVATISSTGLLSAVSQGQTTVQAAFGSFNGSTSLTVGNSVFVPVGNMVTARWGHTATLLPNGKILIVGGRDSSGNYLASAELYDPTTQTFSATGSLVTGRADHTATLLPDGTVLIVGGLIETQSYTFESLGDAQIYNPATGTFAYASQMNEGHYNHTATLLDNGEVLIAGGNYFPLSGGSTPADSELYDPSTHTFTVTGSMVTPRENHTATVLNDGTVLIVGGDIEDGSVPPAAEIYDPTTGTFTATGSLNVASEYHTATLLPSGQVLVAGGYCPSCTSYVLARTELYDPVAKTFALSTSLAVAREDQTATMLNNGTVLVVGGLTASNYTGTAEIFDPSSQTFTGAGSLQNPRDGHTATLLNDGTVLIVGGETVGGLANAELYAPTPPAPFSIQVTPGTVNMVVGGTQQFTAVSNIGYPRTDATWSVSDSGLASITNDSSPVLTALATGQVTITATVDNVSAQAQITISPSGAIPSPGTALWTVPPVPGFLLAQLAQAVPSDGGPGMFSIQSSSDGTQSIVQALTSDGQQLWQAQLPVLNGNSAPDANGGLLVVENQTCKQGQTEPMTIADLDSSTGEPVWQYPAQSVAGSYCYPDAPQMAIRPDGSVVIAAPGNTSGLPEVFIVSGQSGEVEVAPYIPPSSYEDNLGDYIGGYSPIGAPIVDSDGTTYVEYEVRQIAYPPKVTSAILYLMEVTSAGAITSIELSSTTQDENLFPGRIIPDGQGGVFATWVISPGTAPMPTNPYQAAYVVSGAVAVTYSLPFTPKNLVFGSDGLPVNVSLALGEDGVAFATDGVSAGDSTNPNLGPKVVSFNLSSGAVIWSYQVGTQSALSIMAVDPSNGIAVNDSQNGVTQLDDGGNSYEVAGTVGAIAQYSWTGNWYAQTPQGASGFALPLSADPAGTWATPNGNASENGASGPQCACQTQTTDSGDDDGLSGQVVAGAGTSRANGMARSAAPAPPNCSICTLSSPIPPATTSCLPFAGSGGPTYLVIVGDAGLNTNGHQHNVGYGFDLVAQQATNDLQAAGNSVIACRTSSVADFNNALTLNGSINGDVIYVGHSGLFEYETQPKTYASMIFVGQATGPSTDIYALNVDQLCNPPGCNINNYLGGTSAIRIDGCGAGHTVQDVYAQITTSIGQLLAYQLQRNVYAYDGGLYFSSNTAASDRYYDGTDPYTGKSRFGPSILPDYLVPAGDPGSKPGPLLCRPTGTQCGK